MHSGSMSHVAALEMNQEALWLVEHWADRLDRRTVALCRKRHCTAIALEEMRNQTTLPPRHGAPAHRKARLVRNWRVPSRLYFTSSAAISGRHTGEDSGSQSSV